jgi:hypothetical protein
MTWAERGDGKCSAHRAIWSEEFEIKTIFFNGTVRTPCPQENNAVLLLGVCLTISSPIYSIWVVEFPYALCTKVP